MKKTQTTIRRLLRSGWAVIVAALALTSIPADAQISGVNVYPAVPGLPASDKYTVRVCAASNPSAWANAFTFKTKVPYTDSASANANQYYGSLAAWSHSYVNFEMSVPVTVEITKIGGSITSATVRPARKASNVNISGGKAYITLNDPCNVAVDINNQMETTYTGDGAASPIHTISIHGNPVLANKPVFNGTGVLMVTPGTKPPANFSQNTMYFKPGVHDLGTNFQVYAGKQYYIPGDAIVYATFNNKDIGGNGSNIRIFGHGTISGERFKHWLLMGYPTQTELEANSYRQRPIDIENAANSKLEGIVIADSANNSIILGSFGRNASITNVVSWVKVFTWRANGDGGGCGANNDVNHCFMRTQDDGLYVQGLRVTENVLWTDAQGSSMRLSWMNPDLMGSSLLIDNIDVIYNRHNNWTTSCPLSLPDDAAGDRGAGVTFANINFSDPFPNSCAIAIHQNNGNFSGVKFENVTIAAAVNKSYVWTPGYYYNRKNELFAGPGASIHDLTFYNLRIGGTLVTSANWRDYFTTSGNVYNINFTGGSGGTPPGALPRTGWVATGSSGTAQDLANALDGDINSRWATGAAQVNGQWFQVDMGSAKAFDKIVLDAGSSSGDYPRLYEVRVSNDGLNWGSPVANGGGSGAVTTIGFGLQTARYIRVTQTGSAPGIWWSIHEFNVYPPSGLPSPWQTADVGTAAAPGSASYSSPTWTIAGSGADIQNTADAFRYVYQSSSADCSVVANVASMTSPDVWSKSGVMIRESTAANAINAMVCVTPSNGVGFQWRGTTGGTTSYTQVAGPTAPKWLKITRTGSSFAAYYSANGTTWTQVGTAQTISMATTATIGMCVTSHLDGTLCTSTMDSVTATP